VFLDAKCEFDTDINIAGELDQLGELHRLLRCALEIINGEDLEPRLIDLPALARFQSVTLPSPLTNLCACSMLVP